MRPQLFWNGVPVPYVAAWSSEEYSHVAPCKYADNLPAVFRNGSRGEGQPVWGEMHEVRVRETVATGRCQVCNCRLKHERKFAMDVVSQTVTMNGRVQPLLREPLVCTRCVRFTLKHCPGTRRRQEQGTLACFEVFEYRAIAVQMMHAEGGTDALNRILTPGEPVICMSKIALMKFRRLDFDELEREVKL